MRGAPTPATRNPQPACGGSELPPLTAGAAVLRARLDKFFSLVRKAVHQLLQYAKQRKWSAKVVAG